MNDKAKAKAYVPEKEFEDQDNGNLSKISSTGVKRKMSAANLFVRKNPVRQYSDIPEDEIIEEKTDDSVSKTEDSVGSI
jgi:hypothetical protein